MKVYVGHRIFYFEKAVDKIVDKLVKRSKINTSKFLNSYHLSHHPILSQINFFTQLPYFFK